MSLGGESMKEREKERKGGNEWSRDRDWCLDVSACLNEIISNYFSLWVHCWNVVLMKTENKMGKLRKVKWLSLSVLSCSGWVGWAGLKCWRETGDLKSCRRSEGRRKKMKENKKSPVKVCGLVLSKSSFKLVCGKWKVLWVIRGVKEEADKNLKCTLMLCLINNT